MPAYNPRNQRLTIYDIMDQQGRFASNPANPGSVNEAGESIYKRQDFPKMFYHPLGETRITVPAETVVTPFGPKFVGEQREIIWRLAADADEAEALRAEGWHDHPAKALRAAGLEAPPISQTEIIEDKDAEIKRLMKELEEARAGVKPQERKRPSAEAAD